MLCCDEGEGKRSRSLSRSGDFFMSDRALQNQLLASIGDNDSSSDSTTAPTNSTNNSVGMMLLDKTRVQPWQQPQSQQHTPRSDFSRSSNQRSSSSSSSHHCHSASLQSRQLAMPAPSNGPPEPAPLPEGYVRARVGSGLTTTSHPSVLLESNNKSSHHQQQQQQRRVPLLDPISPSSERKSESSPQSPDISLLLSPLSLLAIVPKQDSSGENREDEGEY